MSSGEVELQKAVYAALTNAAGIKALVGNPARVYDAAPADAPMPFIIIGQDELREWGAASVAGYEGSIQIECFANKDRGRLQVKKINDAVKTVLHNSNLSVSNHNLVTCSYIESSTELGDDELTWRGIIKFNIILEQIGG